MNESKQSAERRTGHRQDKRRGQSRHLETEFGLGTPVVGKARLHRTTQNLVDSCKGLGYLIEPAVLECRRRGILVAHEMNAALERCFKKMRNTRIDLPDAYVRKALMAAEAKKKSQRQTGKMKRRRSRTV